MSHILQPNAPQSSAAGTGSAPGTQVRCPRCQTTYTAQIANIIDTRMGPQMKAALLSGYLNRVECPSCGATGVVNVPLIYHDPEKELLLALMPSELNLSVEQQERLVGGLVQAVMSNVPPEERKGYFLRPQTLLTMRSLVEKILEADGVTPEMIETQNRRLTLLSDMLRAAADSTELGRLIAERQGELDYAFFATLMSAAEEAEASGDSTSAEQLIALRDRLLEEPAVSARLPQALPPGTTVEEAIEKLLAVSGDEQAMTAMVALNRPVFDYMFFQGLTAQMEQAWRSSDNVRAEKLSALRARLLKEIEQQDQALQSAQQQDLQLIEELLKSPNRQEAIRQHLAQIDTLFMNTLAAAIQTARQQGDIERSARLDEIRQAIVALLAEAMPPEIRLVNRLLGTQDAGERQAALAESKELLSDDFIELLNGLEEELQSQGRSEVLSRLKTIRDEVRQARAAG